MWRARVEGVTPEPGVSTNRGILSQLDTLIKLAAGGLGVVAAIGFPAVYVQFSRFGIPTHFMTYDQVLRAGALPAVLLALLGLYVYWTAQEFGFSSGRAFVPATVPFLPLLLLVAPVILLGGAAMILLEVWAVVWPFVWIVSKLLSISWTARGVLIVAMVSSVVVIFGWTVVGIIVLIRARTGVAPPAPGPGLARRIAAMAGASPRRLLTHPYGGTLQVLGRRLGPFVINLLTFIAIPLAAVGGVLSLRLVIYMWNPSLTSTLFEARYLSMFGVGAGLGYGLVMTVERMASHPSGRRKAHLIGLAWVVAIYLALVGYYSSTLYGRIPQGLGGGRPVPIVVWVKHADFPGDIARRLVGGRVVRDGDWLRVSDIQLLYAGADVMILTDRLTGPGFVSPRDKVGALSW